MGLVGDGIESEGLMRHGRHGGYLDQVWDQNEKPETGACEET